MNERDKSLSLDDVKCPVCLDIFIEPVTMSCKHELCKECYTEHFKTCNFSCPICKKRLSTWARKAMAKGTLVNKKKWDHIQKEYPDLVAWRRAGNSNSIFAEILKDSTIAEPGEIQAEYLDMRQQWLNEQSSQRREQEEASLRLIQQIQEEEEAEAERTRKLQQENDEKLARQLSEELHMNVSPSRVNRVILRPRRLLSPIDENTPSTSRSRRRSVSARPRTPTTRKRKRALSLSY